MTGSTPSGISRAEADEKTTQNDRDYSFRCNQYGPHEHLARRQPGEVVQAQSCQSESGLFRDPDAVRSSPLRNQEATQPDARREKKIPKAGSLPVVTKMLHPAGQERGAHMSKVAGNTKHSVADNQERRHEQADHWTGDVPRPWGGEESWH